MAYSIVKGDIAEHKEVVLDLWRRNFPEIPDGRFAWIYENNAGGSPTVLLLKHVESGSIVGELALFPRNFFVNGQAIHSYVCGDMVVDRRHRTLGPAMILMKAAVSQCREEAPCALLTLPNVKSEPVALRAGFQVLDDFIEMTKVVKSYRYLLKVVKIPLVARILSVPSDLALNLRSRGFFSCENRKYTCEIISSFDNRFDDLWTDSFKEFSCAGERSRSYLKWRISDSPYSLGQIFILKSETDGKICGYIAYCCDEKRVKIIDIYYNGKLEVLNSLLLEFRHAYRNKCDSISIGFSGNTDIIHVFVKNGYSVRGAKGKLLIFPCDQLPSLITDMKSGNWFVTTLDNDI